MLLVNNIYFNRQSKTILKDVNLSIPPKGIIHLTGNNGVGKTTLLKIICKILNQDEGEIFWNGKNIKKNHYDYCKNITFIFDQNTSNENLTVYENIIFWKKIFSSQIKINEMESILEVLGLLEYKNTSTIHLSFGEIKKLELIRLVIEQKKLWVLDEPFIGLDLKSVEIIIQTITNHIELNGMVIFTSHTLPTIPNINTVNLEINE